jgi:rubrerythrin
MGGFVRRLPGDEGDHQMRTYHEQLLAQVGQERSRLMSRRRLLAGGATLFAGAAALGIAPAGGFGPSSALAQDSMTFKDDVDVLNYALTLEHLEHAFYRDGAGKFDHGMDPFGDDINARFMAIRDHEATHVETLTKVITDLGGEPVAEASYDFGYSDAVSYRMTAAALENTGVMAYDGAGHFLKNMDLITAAGSIVAIEARHASYLNLITGAEPAPEAFEQAKTPGEILKIAGQFITS